MPPRVERGACRLQRGLDDVGHGDGLLAQRDAAARHAGEVEEVVDEARQVGELSGEDGLREGPAPGRLLVGGRFRRGEQLHGAPHRRERVAELVGEGDEELVLPAVRVAERGVRALQGRGRLRVRRELSPEEEEGHDDEAEAEERRDDSRTGRP